MTDFTFYKEEDLLDGTNLTLSAYFGSDGGYVSLSLSQGRGHMSRSRGSCFEEVKVYNSTKETT